MIAPRRLSRCAVAVTLVLMTALGSAQDPPKTLHDVYIDAPTTLSPMSASGARVLVFQSISFDSFSPVEGADVVISLVDRGGKETPLFTGKTGAEGSVEASYPVPALDEGDYTMRVKTTSKNGEYTAQQPVKVRKEFKILLVTDKPLYQPAQTIHIRALALHELSMKAAGGELTFEVEDAKGNKVFKKKETLNDFGVAAADFTLADEVNMGDYRISAMLGQSKAEKAVTVKKYVLPKFKPVVKTDKTWYLPKETVKGTLQVGYFFGKPVSGGDVKIKASTFDVQMKEFAAATTKTDAKGAAEFEIKLPDYFVGQPLEKGNAYVQFEITVTDTADHSETVTKTFSVANSAITLGAIPESGKLIPGIENIVYVVAVSPDGSPIECDVTLKAGKTEVAGRTNESGFAAVKFVPQAADLAAGARGDAVLNATVTAKDKQGNQASKQIALGSELGRDQMLMRIDKGIFRAGETVTLSLYSTFDTGRVFIDAVKGGQTMMTTACSLEKGRAEVKVPLAPSIFGSVEFHAYKILGDGEIVRDTRIVYVHPPEDLQIAISADKTSYKPAETAKIDFVVTGRDGKGVACALGVMVVDEAVYALQDMQPGLEKVYFTLVKELQEPKYGIKMGGSVAGLVQQKELAERQQQTAVILLAPITPAVRTWQANTMAVRMAQFDGKLQAIYYAFQNYIVNQKKIFWQHNATSGKREFKADLIKDLQNDPNVKLAAEMTVDPWGKPVTLATLGAVSASFSFDHWAKLMSAQNLQQLFQTLHAWVVMHDVIEGDGFKVGVLDEMAKAGAIQAAMLKDYFGDPLVLDQLAKDDAAFKPANIEKLTATLRKQAIFDALVQYANTSGGLTFDSTAKAWSFEPALLAKLKVNAGKPRGGEYTLDELMKEQGCFAPSNIAHIASVARRAALYAAVMGKVKADGWEKVAVFDKEWKYAPKLLETLIAAAKLTKAQATDVGGEPFDLDALAKADAQFSPAKLLSAMIAVAVQKIDGAVCSNIHNQQKQLPADPVGELVKLGALKEEDVRDPWGTRLMMTDVKQGDQGLGCGLLGQKTCVSAGPDKQFGTADDIRYSRVAASGAYQPNYGGCVFHQQDGSVIRHMAWGYDHGDDARLASGPRSQPQGGTGKVVAGRSGGRPSPSKESKKSADMLEKSKNGAGEEGEDDSGMPGGIRVREFFPETLLWKPMMITDAQGRASLSVEMADSITQWRLTASASTIDGRLGSTTQGILVFQPFFVDIDFPVALTQNDAVSVPVAVYNYLKEPQTITLKVDKEDWFELRDEETKRLDLKSGEVRAVYFRVKVTGLGSRKFTVTAWGKDEAARDAIRRAVEIVPDGKMFEVVVNDRLSPKIDKSVEIPANAIPGSFKIFCKCYPGVFSQVVEGVEGMLGMPHG